MSETKLATKADLKEMYDRMLPYMGGMPEMLANKFSKGDLYSTDEKMIGQWIDGKPLYQKTVDCGFMPNNTDKSVPHNITNLDRIISVIGNWTNPNHTEMGILPRVGYLNNQYFINIYVTPTNIVLSSNTDQSSRSGYVTVQYTKTTDSAISIGSDTDYSTDEKVVGTWIDGKPIWQKTFAYTNLEISNADSWIELENISSLNIDIENGFFKSEGTFHIVNTALYAPITTTNRNGTDIYTKGVAVRLSNHSDYGHDSLQIISTQIQTFVSAYITIQYTKTTS